MAAPSWINDMERAKTLELLYQKLCQFMDPAPGPPGAAPGRDADQRWALAKSVEQQILQQARSRADYAQQLIQRVHKLADPKQAAFVAMVKAADEGQRQVVLAFWRLTDECRGQFLKPLVSGLKTAKAYVTHLDAEIKGGQLPPETLVHSKLAYKKVMENYGVLAKYIRLLMVLETGFLKHGRMPTAQDYAGFQRGMEKLRQDDGRLTQFIQHVKTQFKEALQRRSDAGGAARPVERITITKVVSRAPQAKGPPQVGRKPEPEQGCVPAKTGGGATAAAPAAQQGLGTPAEDGQRLPAVQARLAAGLEGLDPAGRQFLQAVSRNALHAGDGAGHKPQKVGFLREEALRARAASRGAPSRD